MRHSSGPACRTRKATGAVQYRTTRLRLVPQLAWALRVSTRATGRPEPKAAV
ncbi:hypothetical protein [Streptomyces shaanxiensis]|uniref:hypothetical protein n=1 Tax=Streptomyces shaanxiensis TaxID=653357 RepID=UPI0031ECFDE0